MCAIKILREITEKMFFLSPVVGGKIIHFCNNSKDCCLLRQRDNSRLCISTDGKMQTEANSRLFYMHEASLFFAFVCFVYFRIADEFIH